MVCVKNTNVLEICDTQATNKQMFDTTTVAESCEGWKRRKEIPVTLHTNNQLAKTELNGVDFPSEPTAYGIYKSIS